MKASYDSKRFGLKGCRVRRSRFGTKLIQVGQKARERLTPLTMNDQKLTFGD